MKLATFHGQEEVISNRRLKLLKLVARTANAAFDFVTHQLAGIWRVTRPL